MDSKTIDLLYRSIMELSNGVKKVKVDLHVHTPASSDFEYKPLSKDGAFFNILDQAILNKIRVIAITDHNTFSGINHIRELLKDKKVSDKYSDLLILCGIEITCFSKHLIAVFPNDFDEEKQKFFLNEIGIDSSAEGSEDSLADNLGPSLLINKISEYGGFSVLAHADSNNGFLQNLCSSGSTSSELSITGKSLAKIIKSPSLLAIQCNNDINKDKLIGKLNNQDYLRINNPLAYIKCSDCHGINTDKYYGKSGHEIGRYYSELKLSEFTFESLKMALLDSEMRVCNEIKTTDYAFIQGVAVKSSIFTDSNEYSYFHFSEELNCVIGSRGTGKTTLLEIIQSIIMPNNLKGKDLNRAFEKYISAVVFIKNNDNIYAVSNEPVVLKDDYIDDASKLSNLKIYVLNKVNMKFSIDKGDDDKEFLSRFLTAGYQQRQLYIYSQNPNKILDIVDDFISWKHHDDYKKVSDQIEHLTTRLEKRLAEIQKKRQDLGLSFYDYITQKDELKFVVKNLSLINRRKNELSKMRASMVSELNNVLTGKVVLTLSKRFGTSQWMEIIENLSERARRKKGKGYDYELEIHKFLSKVYLLSSKFADDFQFNIMLLESKFKEIDDNFKYSVDIDDDDLIIIRDQMAENDILVFLDDKLNMQYNINMGTEHTPLFRDNTQISMGQNAVALLLLILNAAYNLNDNRPLLMDQPEDDLDNSYIYSTLVKEFRNSKQKRQVIISTHNPNIPVAADAENILVLRYNGRYSTLTNTGGIDSESIANDVLEIMEGGKDAIKRRTDKYNARYTQS